MFFCCHCSWGFRVWSLFCYAVITDISSVEIILARIRLAPVLKQVFINVSYHILVASLTLMALFSSLGNDGL